MIRRLCFVATCALPLLAFVATAISWARSYFVIDSWHWTAGNTVTILTTRHGTISYWIDSVCPRITSITYWEMSILTGFLPLMWTADYLIFQRRPRTAPPNGCRSCGYDLRASPEQCPECGTTAPTKPEATT